MGWRGEAGERGAGQGAGAGAGAAAEGRWATSRRGRGDEIVVAFT